MSDNPSFNGDPLRASPSEPMVVTQDHRMYRNPRNVNVYEFMEHVYCGGDGFSDGRYLIPHPKEPFYNTRREISFYKNYFKPILDAMVDPVFHTQIDRQYDNDFFNQFISNADAAGTPLQDMIKEAMLKARLLGCPFVVMDNFNSDGIPETVDDVINQRAFPYIYLKMPNDVFQMETDIHGNLTSIIFFDGCEKQSGVDIRRYREWDAVGWTEYYTKNQNPQSEDDLIESASGVHGLGMLPVIPVNDFNHTRSMCCMPLPPMRDLAWLNFALFCLESEIRMMSQSQCFSTLCVPSDGPIALGLNNALAIPTDAKFAPTYISPDAAHFNNLVAYADRAKNDIYLIANQNGVVGVKQATSGIAKEWDFRAQESVLKSTAKAASDLETKISLLFMAYIKSTFTYAVTYASQFSPTHTADMIALYLSMAKEMPPTPILNRLWLEMSKLVWKDDQEGIDALQALMESTQIDRSANNPLFMDKTEMANATTN